MHRARPLLALALLLASACSSSKSQHEQAVEWITFYGGAVQQVQADAHLLHIAIDNLYQSTTSDACTAVTATARMVAGDLAAEPAHFTKRLGPGRVSDAVQSLAPGGRNLAAAVTRVQSLCSTPNNQRQAVVDGYSQAVAAWNAALVAIWGGAGRPLPPVLGF